VGGYDQLNVSGSASLAGTLATSNISGYSAANLYHYKVMTFGSRTGVFTSYTGTNAGNGLVYAPVYIDKDLTLVATLPGDANVDSKVDFNDLVALAQDYNTIFSATTDNWWGGGDFNYDGKVDFSDLVLLAQHYNGSITPAPADLPARVAGDWGAALAGASVPEPTVPAISFAAAASERATMANRYRKFLAPPAAARHFAI
jgi:hypothetical protein